MSGALPQRRVVWVWFGAFPGAFGLGRAQPQRRGLPYWPQLCHCLFIQARTQAYLEKRLGADFYKVSNIMAT